MYKAELTLGLTAKSIDIIADEAVKACKSLKMRSEDSARVRILLEESLLVWQDRFGEEKEIHLQVGQNRLHPSIVISFKSDESCNPFPQDNVGYSQTILDNLQVTPEYSYQGGQNRFVIHLKRPPQNPLITLLEVIAVSIVFGLLGKFVIPENVIKVIEDGLINPTYDTFLSVLGCAAGPLIFFSVAWGVYGIGDTATLSRLGKGMMVRFIGATFLAGALSAFAYPIFKVTLSGGGFDFSQIFEIYSMFLDMFPGTIIEPFASGNTLQIIVLAMIVGVAMLFLGRKTRAVAVAIEQINLIVTFLMEFISKLVPAFIVIVLVSIIWSDSLEIISGTVWFLGLLMGALVIDCLVFLLFNAIKQRANPWYLLRKALPAYLIALATASSAATFGTLVRTCEKDYGISNSLTGFGIPLSVIMQKTATVINYMFVSLYLASVNNLTCSVSWLVMAVIISSVTAVATPPIPGGGIIGYTMLFTQLGIPLESGLGIALALDMLSDFLMTSTDMFCAQFGLINVASHFDLIDKKILRAKKTT